MKLLLLTVLTCLVSFASQANEDSSPAGIFYTAFANHDAATMGQLYADSAVFSDPIFPGLSSLEVRAMWRMLLGSTDLSLAYQIESQDEAQAVVAWRAEYTFSTTGRRVVNLVRSTLTLQNGKIIGQKDEFDLCKWADMAIGSLKSHAVCWFPDQTIRKQARENLTKFMSSGK